MAHKFTINSSANFSSDLEGTSETGVTGAGLHQIILWLQAPIGVLIVVINVITLILLWKAATIQSSLRALFVNMAVSDALAGSVFIFNCFIFYYPDILDATTCGIRYGFMFTTILVSLTTVGLLTVDRCLTLSFPLTYANKLTTRHATIICTVPWFVGVIMAYFTYKFALESFTSCRILVMAVHTEVFIVPGVYFFAIVAIVIGSYTVIIYHARKHSRQIECEQAIAGRIRARLRENPNSLYRNEPGDIGMDQEMEQIPKTSQRKSRYRYLKTVTILVAAILLSYVPTAGCYIYFLAWPRSMQSEMSTIVINSSLFIVILNSLANPLLYTWKTPQLRKEFLKMFCSRSQRCTTWCQSRLA